MRFIKISTFSLRFARFILVALLTNIVASKALSQWRTETFDLVAGWQAIHLRVDTELTPIDTVLKDYPQIEEVWRWRPSGLDEVILDSPDEPVSGVEWQIWKRFDRANTNLSVFYSNSAYLVKVASGSPSFTLSIKGQVTSPITYWRTDGLNLLGFPTNPNSPPSIEDYFGPAEVLDQLTEIYEYAGGDLVNGVNPFQITSRSAEVVRGKGYWIRSNKYADYDGPLRVRAAIGEGIDFGDSRPTVRVILTNRTDRFVDAIFTPQNSEPAPGATITPQSVPLTRRVRSSSGSFVYEPFRAPITISLKPEETLGITLGIDRSQLLGQPGDRAYSLLKVNDGEGLSEFYVPANAEVASLAGLWVGEAEITHVQNQLQRFQKDEDDVYLVDEDGRYIPEFRKDDDGNLIEDDSGDLILDMNKGLNRTDQVYRLRLILHVDDTGRVRMLNRAYVGTVALGANRIPIFGISKTQARLLPDYLESAARVSSVHLPQNTDVTLSGDFKPGGQLAGTLSIAHDSPGNPFIHTYHPDHDNLDARFENALPDGNESYRIDRSFIFTIPSDAGIIEDPSWGTTLLTGIYAETISGLHKDSIAVKGVLALRRVSDISSITP